jgi:hypothetical protein
VNATPFISPSLPLEPIDIAGGEQKRGNGFHYSANAGKEGDAYWEDKANSQRE